MGVLATAAVVKAAEMAVVTEAVVMEEEVRVGGAEPVPLPPPPLPEAVLLTLTRMNFASLGL